MTGLFSTYAKLAYTRFSCYIWIFRFFSFVLFFLDTLFEALSEWDESWSELKRLDQSKELINDSSSWVMVINTIHWFRKGLRLHDNPSLKESLLGADTVRCVYILDPWFAGSSNVGINRWRWAQQALMFLTRSAWCTWLWSTRFDFISQVWVQMLDLLYNACTHRVVPHYTLHLFDHFSHFKRFLLSTGWFLRDGKETWQGGSKIKRII